LKYRRQFRAVPLSEHMPGISKNKITQHFTCIAQLYVICTHNRRYADPGGCAV